MLFLYLGSVIRTTYRCVRIALAYTLSRALVSVHLDTQPQWGTQPMERPHPLRRAFFCCLNREAAPLVHFPCRHHLAPVASGARYLDVAPYPHIGVEQFPDRHKPPSIPRSEKVATIFFHRPLAKAFRVKMNIVPLSGTTGDYLSSHRGAIRNTFSNPFQTLLQRNLP